MAAKAPEPIREMAVAGMFYPGDTEQLTRDVDAMLDTAPDVDLDGEIVALVCPHAGYPYSGATAAAGYRQVRGERYDAVIVMGPSHREPFEGASVFCKGSYQTPLGAVPIAEDLASAIVSHGGADVQAGWLGHQIQIDPFRLGPRGEHALEVQLPFMQRVLDDLRILPMVIGQYDPQMCCLIGDAIADGIGDRRVLLVVSSDLYHGENDRACRESDARTLAAIEKLDADGLASGLRDRTSQACGGGPILIALRVAKRLGVTHAEILARTNSNEVMGKEGSYVVGYGTVALVRS